MRLVCPNCGAQYEVDIKVIPEAGRDVQCSACGHAWYERPYGYSEAEEEAAEKDDDLSPGAETEETAPAAPAPEPQQTPPAVQRREIDEGVRDILQEEAQREMLARAHERVHEPEPVETQPDLGLDQSGPAEKERRDARERMAQTDDAEDSAETDDDLEMAAGPEPTRGRDLFPDIEEINSTLDSHNEGFTPRAMPKATSGIGGFTRGFLLVIVLAAVGVAIYLFAPQLSARVPALEPALTAYVEAVNNARSALDEALRGLIVTIEGMAENGGS